MKQIMEQIMVNIADQEVTAINTQTSEHATESDAPMDTIVSPISIEKSQSGKETTVTVRKQNVRLTDLVRQHKRRTEAGELRGNNHNHQNYEVNGHDSNRSVEASPILKFMSKSFIQMKKPQNNRLSNEEEDKRGESELQSPYNLTDKSTPLMLQFRTQSHLNGATGGGIQNTFLAKQLQKELTDTSHQNNESSIPIESSAKRSIVEDQRVNNNESFSSQRLITADQQAFPSQSSHNSRPAKAASSQQHTLAQILLKGSRTPGPNQKQQSLKEGPVAAARPDSIFAESLQSSIQRVPPESITRCEQEDFAQTSAKIVTSLIDDQHIGSVFLDGKESYIESQREVASAYLSCSYNQSQLAAGAPTNLGSESLRGSLKIVQKVNAKIQRISKKKSKKNGQNRRTVLTYKITSEKQKDQPNIAQASEVTRSVNKDQQKISLQINAIESEDVTPRPGVNRRSKVGQKPKSAYKMTANESSLTLDKNHQQTGKLQTAKAATSRKSLPIQRAIQLSNPKSQSISQITISRRKDKESITSQQQQSSSVEKLLDSRQTAGTNNASPEKRLAIDELKIRRMAQSALSSGVNIVLNMIKTPRRRANIFDISAGDLSNRLPDQNNLGAAEAASKYQLPSTQKLFKVNMLAQSRIGQKSFIERGVSNTSRASSNRSVKKITQLKNYNDTQKQVQTTRENKDDPGSLSIKHVQTIKPLGLKDCLKSPTGKTTFALSSQRKKYSKAGKQHRKGVVASEVMIDLTSSEVANEYLVSHSQAVTSIQRRSPVIKILCIRQVVQHLSFRELCDILQLCNKTRFSANVHKCQKDAYLQLLQRGQIEMDRVHPLRCRMWFQRLNIQISQQETNKTKFQIRRQNSQQNSTPHKSDIIDEDFATIEADLRRSNFSMPGGQKSGLLQDEMLKEALQDVLQRLARQLSCGYLQGMHYVVLALYRITSSLAMTHALSLKLFRNEKLTKAFLDNSANTIDDLCNQLRVFISAYLPRLGQAMEDVGVETDYFAHTWFLTLLFHFQVNESLNSHQRKAVSINSQRVLESLVLDFLCLDDVKSLIKVPLCALQQLELQPDALDQMSQNCTAEKQMMPQVQRHIRGAQKKNVMQKGSFKLNLHRQSSFRSQGSGSCPSDKVGLIIGNEQSQSDRSRNLVATDDEADDSEKLVRMIKQTAAEYMSGYAQLGSSKFKREQAASRSVFSFFQTQPSMEQTEQNFLVRNFVESYQSFKVSQNIYAQLQEKKTQASVVAEEEQNVAELKTTEGQEGGGGSISIMKSNYLSNIKQGAINTLNLGCHLFGFGGNENETESKDKTGQCQQTTRDQHHISFVSSSFVEEMDEGDELANWDLAPLSQSKSMPKFEKPIRISNDNQVSKTQFSLQALKLGRPKTVVKKMQNVIDLTQDQLLSRAPIAKIVAKQLQVSGDAESIYEQGSAKTQQSVSRDVSSAHNDGRSTMLILDSSDPPAKPNQDTSLLQKRSQVEVSGFEYPPLNKDNINLKGIQQKVILASPEVPKLSQLLSQNVEEDQTRNTKNLLPSIEDIHETDEHTLIANKIRISNIKGSHTSILSPSHISGTEPNKKAQMPTFLSSPSNKSRVLTRQGETSLKVSQKKSQKNEKVNQESSQHHPTREKPEFQKTSSKDLLSLSHAANRIFERDAAKDVNSDQEKSLDQSIPQPTHQMPVHKQKMFLWTDQCKATLQNGSSMVNEESIQDLGSPSLNVRQVVEEFGNQMLIQRVPSDRTLSVNSLQLTIPQGKTSSNIKGLAQILKSTKRVTDGSATQFAQKMFRKKNSAGAVQVNVRSKRNNLFAAQNGHAMVRTPSLGRLDDDLKFGQMHQSYNSDEYYSPKERQRHIHAMSPKITSVDKANVSLHSAAVNASFSKNSSLCTSQAPAPMQTVTLKSKQNEDPEQQAQISQAARNAVYSLLKQQLTQEQSKSQGGMQTSTSAQLNSFFERPESYEQLQQKPFSLINDGNQQSSGKQQDYP